jgi:hypothetical protein
LLFPDSKGHLCSLTYDPSFIFKASISNPFVTLTFLYPFFVEGRQGERREINECYSEAKKNQSWEMLPEDQRRVISTQRLEWPMK